MPNTDRIKFSRADGRVRALADQVVLADSTDVIILTENGYRPRLYFPRQDMNAAVLEPSDHRTTCPFKGTATYYTAKTDQGTLQNIAWAYDDPISDAAEIKGRIAFYEEKLTVEGV